MLYDYWNSKQHESLFSPLFAASWKKKLQTAKKEWPQQSVLSCVENESEGKCRCSWILPVNFCFTRLIPVINWLSVNRRLKSTRITVISCRFTDRLVLRRWTNNESTQSYSVQSWQKRKYSLPSRHPEVIFFKKITSSPSNLWPCTIWPGHNYSSIHQSQEIRFSGVTVTMFFPACCMQILSFFVYLFIYFWAHNLKSVLTLTYYPFPLWFHTELRVRTQRFEISENWGECKKSIVDFSYFCGFSRAESHCWLKALSCLGPLKRNGIIVFGIIMPISYLLHIYHLQMLMCYCYWQLTADTSSLSPSSGSPGWRRLPAPLVCYFQPQP